MTSLDNSLAKAERFIARWQGHEGGQERANYGLFLTELCDVLDLKHPDVANASHEFNDYVFERAVRRHRDEGESIGRIDLYKKAAFVLEAKQSRWKGKSKEITGQNDLFSAEAEPADRGKRGASRAWDVLMLNAKRQAEEYARALPTSHGWPPFILVCDVGHCIEVYADFSGQGKNYTQFPDRKSFRIYLEDLRKPEVRERLYRIWEEPLKLDPARTAAKATRDIAERLAEVSKALEAKKYPPEEVAHFLMRCLFTMFAASVKLLPDESFRDLLADCRKDPSKFVPLLTDLWKSMNDGEFAASIRTKVLKFNGNLFAAAQVLPLGREEIGELYEASQKDWHEVEPAIFGTLLEQALDPTERRRLGAHYTPRSYVERLVVGTIIEPLREDWRNVQAAAETKRAAGDTKGAAAEVKAFHDILCETRVLDPACGTGNFLYVSMELMKRLEGEVLEALADLTEQGRFAGYELRTLDPHQFLGMEINPRAAAIAELVLWIGYLQWHFRIRGGIPPEPILRRFKNIEVKNAVLTWDSYPQVPLVDGKETYSNPKRPTWSMAEFIVGNPPFLGKGVFMRDAFGSAYVEALSDAHTLMNDSADFVMYWWDMAAEILTRKGTVLRRFGFVTTNSIDQIFNRKVLERHLKSDKSLIMAIPDHPWTKASPEAAAVRIAMTVVQQGDHQGTLHRVVDEDNLETDEPRIALQTSRGKINSDLTIGVDVTSARPLLANEGLASMGPALGGRGFVLTKLEAEHLSKGKLVDWLKKLTTGRDITDGHRERFAIDVRRFENEESLRKSVPQVYQHLKATVFPERKNNNDPKLRTFWWRYRRSNETYFGATEDLKKFIATVETTKHRVFIFVGGDELLEHGVIGFGTADAYLLGILSSSTHVCWTLANGGTLEDRPRYNKDVCFDPFPFPSPGQLLKSKIRTAAEELDTFRKERLKEYSELTLTQMYNVLEKLKANAPLDKDDEEVKNKGLILILKELHERLDKLVFEAYGWADTISDQEILEKLVGLNRERAEEERRGHVRWLRPDYQIPRFGAKLDKQAAKEEQIVADLGLPEPAAKKILFPSDAVGQTAAVFAVLLAADEPMDSVSISATFRKSRNLQKSIADVVASLVRLGHVTTRDGKRYEIRRAA